ncbi:MAG: FMN-binding negative transcriptional regulator [Betaproteobacteria bacterium]|nr:FMN-binding negative transcriptional regulator [Betaproteobacteria bacterium]MBI2958960.1 FMN-binding negative transcriptional regulator [Betaproteobacteria bacterium]
MYVPNHFQETDIGVLHRLIRAHPLGSLVTMTENGLEANHIPFLLDTEPEPFGTLRCHVARANPLWREFSREVEALAIFQGPESYVSPSWYPSKREHGKAVPTWNYALVHGYGRISVIDDPVWIRAHLEGLVAQHEAGRPLPWKVADAPRDYIDAMVGAIVGLEIPLARLLGKWKVSQNRSPEDREGVVEGLASEGSESARAIAELVRQIRHGNT